MEDPEVEYKVVEIFNPLRYKDLATSGFGPLEPFLKLCWEFANQKKAYAVIINTASCLESFSLSWLQQELGVRVYPLGPLHITASASSSLLEEDKSCIEWLNKHNKPRSVIYISLGSLHHMETKEVLEMAWGLCNSNQPFLWVIRAGSIAGLDSLPMDVSKMVSERGYIVKWAPQIEILGHPAVGGFWSHCGWNSTLDSIAEGVPIICRPFNGEQKLNAMYIESVWNVGIQLEGEVERRAVERAVKRLIVDEEGQGMRERVLVLKEKIKASVRSGGSSYNALDELVKFLKTEARSIGDYLLVVLASFGNGRRTGEEKGSVGSGSGSSSKTYISNDATCKNPITVDQFNFLSFLDDFIDYEFFTIPESLRESDFEILRPILLKFNKEFHVSFKNCLCEEVNGGQTRRGDEEESRQFYKWRFFTQLTR
ncbi:hypothetical protein AALP_AA5G088400 [Arabis alpina]|uniref:UDP-glycosyltransferases domain-containing protein n=1 Tax=Arabis alpina TaxID=50452 RepID=A0A087GVU6_ARAAL|nr:hypothetical protein AALP_AA5G088400 [Arabis alpina]